MSRKISLRYESINGLTLLAGYRISFCSDFLVMQIEMLNRINSEEEHHHCRKSNPPKDLLGTMDELMSSINGRRSKNSKGVDGDKPLKIALMMVWKI